MGYIHRWSHVRTPCLVFLLEPITRHRKGHFQFRITKTWILALFLAVFVCHRSSGDDAETACQREAEEELGLTVEKQELKHIFSTKQQFVLRNGTPVL